MITPLGGAIEDVLLAAVDQALARGSSDPDAVAEALATNWLLVVSDEDFMRAAVCTYLERLSEEADGLRDAFEIIRAAQAFPLPTADGPRS